MANTKVGDVISIDSTGDLSSLINKGGVKVMAMTVLASADTWAVDIQVTDGGQSLLQAQGQATNDRGTHQTYPGGVLCERLFVKTLTDITKVLLYVHGRGIN